MKKFIVSLSHCSTVIHHPVLLSFNLIIMFLIHNSSFVIRNSYALESHTFYYHTDQVGSVMAVTDENGIIIQQSKYLPYGSEQKITDNLQQTTYNQERSYTNQIKDKNTALFYYNARYYDPTLSRFISADLTNDQANRYNYVGGNPVMRNDPGGNICVRCALEKSWAEGYGPDTVPVIGGFPAIPNSYNVMQYNIPEIIEKAANTVSLSPALLLSLSVNEGLGHYAATRKRLETQNLNYYKKQYEQQKKLFREYYHDKNQLAIYQSELYQLQVNIANWGGYQGRIESGQIDSFYYLSIDYPSDFFEVLKTAGYYNDNENPFAGPGEERENELFLRAESRYFKNLEEGIMFQAKIITYLQQKVRTDSITLGINIEPNSEYERRMIYSYYNMGFARGRQFMKSTQKPGFKFDDYSTWDDGFSYDHFIFTNSTEATHQYYKSKDMD